VALAGATEKAGLSSFNWHMCRHTISTRLLEVADMVTVQEFVGHQSLNTTRRYTHPGKPGKRNAGDDLLKRRVARADQSGAKEEVGFGHILVTVPQRDAVGENVV
jgi:integrase